MSAVIGIWVAAEFKMHALLLSVGENACTSSDTHRCVWRQVRCGRPTYRAVYTQNALCLQVWQSYITCSFSDSVCLGNVSHVEHPLIMHRNSVRWIIKAVGNRFSARLEFLGAKMMWASPHLVWFKLASKHFWCLTILKDEKNIW